jgi:hypothetical protein
MTWMPSRVPFVAACRISGGIVVASGIMLLGLFLVMVVHYGAWR